MEELIYLDNAATTRNKPQAVEQALLASLRQGGNPGRSAAEPALFSLREIYKARCQIADISAASDPLAVAFTSGATESLNLALKGLINPEDQVITTVFEHNSVLRPLRQIGCELLVLGIDDSGQLVWEELEEKLSNRARFFVCTHGSNVLGTILPLEEIYQFCQRHELILIADIAQTFGCYPLSAQMADVLCFAGHKALFGPMGTGGVISKSHINFRPLKTGGNGQSSLGLEAISASVPEVFEAGTPNVPGIMGLAAGVAFVQDQGIDRIRRKEQALIEQFVAGCRAISGLRLYGPLTEAETLPVISLNVADLTSQETAERLWEGWRIAIRAGLHCAPLLHEAIGTGQRGTVRFSFSYFTTEVEVEQSLTALRAISRDCLPR